MGEEKFILAIDQGTTGSRAAAYDKKGRKIASSYQEFPQHFPRPGWVEHDPDQIWESVDSSIQKVLRLLPRGAGIKAIGITNQRETTIVWDRKTGRPVYNAIVWQCRRTAARCEALKKTREAAAIKKKTGLPVDAYFSATKIEWILSNVKGARRLAQQGRLCFGTPDAWVLWKLTGGKVHATDYTNASRTMLFNIEEMAWDAALLKKFSIPPAMLPEVRSSSGIFGVTSGTGELPGGVPVAGIAGDQQAALFGQACFESGSIKNTYGTGSFVLLNTGNKRKTSKFGLITTIGCGRDGEPVYVLEGSIFSTGSAVQWMRDGLKLFKNAAQTEDMAGKVKDNGGVYFVPALVGLGAPYWDPSARGGIFGITRCTTRDHFARAALEAMCYQTRDVIEAMRKDSGLKIRSLRIDGGATANDLLCQLQADMLGCDVIRPEDIETTSAGAAYLAGLAAGYWKSVDEIKKFRRKDRVFSPRLAKEERERLYLGWLEAVSRTLSRRTRRVR
jgi:glycerol kinase